MNILLFSAGYILVSSQPPILLISSRYGRIVALTFVAVVITEVLQLKQGTIQIYFFIYRFMLRINLCIFSNGVLYFATVLEFGNTNHTDVK